MPATIANRIELISTTSTFRCAGTSDVPWTSARRVPTKAGASTRSISSAGAGPIRRIHGPALVGEWWDGKHQWRDRSYVA